MPVATSWHRFFHVSRSSVVSRHRAFQPSQSFITASRCFLAFTFKTTNRTRHQNVTARQDKAVNRMSKVVWNTYFSVPPSSWWCGPRVETGCAPVSRCHPSGDHTLWPHGYSPLGDELLRLLSLHYSCYYQQCNNTCHALVVIK